jgi:uracil-DNA glycosylase
MTWNDIFKKEKSKDYYKKLELFINNEYKTKQIFPKKENIFLAFDLCKYDDVKVVILGQDPYHQPNQAQGLAFSTKVNIKNPPSLKNILKEVVDDVGDTQCETGDLSIWAKQGILLINTVLTVEYNKPNSHKNCGWQEFTDNIIKYISENNKNIIFVLWGSNAIKKSKFIDKQHHIISSVHPSPLSSYRGFFGSKPFSKVNSVLKNIQKDEIRW